MGFLGLCAWQSPFRAQFPGRPLWSRISFESQHIGLDHMRRASYRDALFAPLCATCAVSISSLLLNAFVLGIPISVASSLTALPYANLLSNSAHILRFHAPRFKLRCLDFPEFDQMRRGGVFAIAAAETRFAEGFQPLRFDPCGMKVLQQDPSQSVAFAFMAAASVLASFFPSEFHHRPSPRGPPL